MRCGDALTGAKPLIGARRAPLEATRSPDDGVKRTPFPRHPKREMRRIGQVPADGPELCPGRYHTTVRYVFVRPRLQCTARPFVRSVHIQLTISHSHPFA